VCLCSHVCFRVLLLIVLEYVNTLQTQLQDDSTSSDNKLSAAARSKILSQMKDREKRLSGVYQQLSVQFADLHDTPGRMAATGAVKKVYISYSMALQCIRSHACLNCFGNTPSCTQYILCLL
jgi:Carboxyl transferase domain